MTLLSMIGLKFSVVLSVIRYVFDLGFIYLFIYLTLELFNLSSFFFFFWLFIVCLISNLCVEKILFKNAYLTVISLAIPGPDGAFPLAQR